MGSRLEEGGESTPNVIHEAVGEPQVLMETLVPCHMGLPVTATHTTQQWGETDNKRGRARGKPQSF